MSLKLIRQICMFVLPILLLASSLSYYLGSQRVWSEWFYIISLTANIGYFTNYIAIKMLFKPYQKTAFGRQGLIPKNQKKLANSLSETLIENFLSQDLWREYLFKSNVVNKVINEAESGTKNWLLQKENHAVLISFTIDYLKTNQDPINQVLKSFQDDVIDNLSSQFDPNQLLAQGFDWLETQFADNPAKMNYMIEPIIRAVAENIPQISQSLVTALDNHIEDQDTIKRGFAKMARWSTDFSEDDVKNYLFRMVASSEFRQTLFNGLQSLLNEYKNKPELLSFATESNSFTSQEASFSGVTSDFIHDKLDSIKWVDMFINKLEAQQKAARSIEIQNFLLSIHQIAFDKIEHEMSNGPLHTWIIDELVSMIDKLDLKEMVKQKASDFSPKKIETVFQNMISEQLVFIELLGAVLGALSGLALIDIRAFGVLSVLLMSCYMLDRFFTSRRFLETNYSN